MEICYLCGKQLTNTNASWEHIIPNALGGHLKSNTLICKDCNNRYGEKYDSKLIQELDFYPTYLMIKRDSGKIQPIVLTDPLTGEKYKVSPDGALSKTSPKVQIGKDGIFQIEARNINEVKSILSNISEKYGNFDPLPFIEKAVISSERLNDPLYKYSKIGNQEMLLSILKTALNYFILKTGEHKSVKNAVKELQNGCTTIVEPIALEKRLFDLEAEEIAHSIYLNGRKNNKLYAIIEYFNIFQFAVKLSENYIGEDIEYIYIFDVIQRKELTKKIRNLYSCEYIFQSNRSNIDMVALNNSKKRFDEIAEHRRFLYTIEKIIHGVWQDVIESNVNENEAISSTIVENFLLQAQSKLGEFLLRVYEKI